ncbi:Beta-lactamase [Paludibacter propionicigenes WB4]|uniref:beta-lactamase n=1 Tax=Paludibacter propionicigenes (strain DSM 17365 / JCM 13257 / WB4) TaxID=694427 RepID=E4T2G5_PALPW|nr:subclass B1 metallo-beta-lactamase [Paludibacter propionicigenes]ADQ78909.1 Beta-lactamase [Paludibacter propionicigenes WB4]
MKPKIHLTLFVFLLSLTNLFAQTNYQLTKNKADQLDRNFAITQLTNNAFLIQSSFAANGQLDCNHLLIIDTKDLVLVNTPVNDSLTSVLLACIEKKFKRKVTKVIVSHFHEDSSGGLRQICKLGINSFGLSKTASLLKSQNKHIDFLFTSFFALDLQTLHLELFYPGAGHSIDNIVIWLPEDKILFGGCLLKSLEAKDKGNIKDADLKAWPVSVELIKKKYQDAIIVIPGHGEIGNTSVFEHTLKLLANN